MDALDTETDSARLRLREVAIIVVAAILVYLPSLRGWLSSIRKRELR